MSVPAQGRAAVVEVLNGDAHPGSRGFNLRTYGEDRMLFVGYGVTRDMAEALLLCRHGGVLSKKFNAMEPAAAWCAYFLTLARPEAVN
jgi:hypothetical protein